MGNGVSSDQGNLPSYGKREVRRAVDRKQHDWSELAGMSETDLLLAAANPYIIYAYRLLHSVICTQTKYSKNYE